MFGVVFATNINDYYTFYKARMIILDPKLNV